MIAGSSIASPRIFWHSKATAMSNGSRAISRITRRTRCGVWGRILRFRTGSNTKSSVVELEGDSGQAADSLPPLGAHFGSNRPCVANIFVIMDLVTAREPIEVAGEYRVAMEV